MRSQSLSHSRAELFYFTLQCGINLFHTPMGSDSIPYPNGGSPYFILLCGMNLFHTIGWCKYIPSPEWGEYNSHSRVEWINVTPQRGINLFHTLVWKEYVSHPRVVQSIAHAKVVWISQSSRDWFYVTLHCGGNLVRIPLGGESISHSSVEWIYFKPQGRVKLFLTPGWSRAISYFSGKWT